MTRDKAIINAFSVTWATDTAKANIDFTRDCAADLADDIKRKERLAKGECLACFYIHSSRLGGAAMTTRPCGICEKDMSFGSTSVDVVCKECSVAHKICRHCGADIKLRSRRVFGG